MFRSCDMNGIVVGWSEPALAVSGDALLAGYKVYVNSKFQTQLDPEETTFHFTQGLMCREYSFQVKI